MTTEAEPKSNVSPKIISQAFLSLDKYILEHYGRPTRRTLRERQITVFEDLRNTLKEGTTEGYVVLPTGVGKTVLFTEFSEAINQQEILQTMIVVPTQVLVDQTEKRFKQFAPELDVGKLYTYAHDITKPITITTYASLVRHIANGTLDPTLTKLLVLDEVHRSLSRKRIQAVAQFTDAIKLGFTATPMYSEERQVANLLNTEIHRMSIKEAVEEDLLSPFSAIIAQTEVDLTDISVKSNGDYDDKELEEAINIESRNQAALDLYLELFQGQTAVAYCISVKHAQNLARIFHENGVPAAYVSGYQDKKEQAEILRRYHEGEIKVLCNADLLIEGFDEPRASVCLNVRPTRSLVVAQQRAGRVLRLDPDNPNKHATVVDFLDKTEDPRKLPVTFAEVAEAAFIVKKRLDRDTTTGPSMPKAPPGSGDIGIGPDEDIITISGLKVIVNPQEIMRVVKERQDKIYTIPPEGWLNAEDLTKLRNKKPESFKLHAERFRGTNPEWFGLFKGLEGHITEYYSSELSSELLNLEGGSLVPEEGWKSIMEIVELTSRDYATVTARIKSLGEIDDQTSIYLSPTTLRPTVYYHPDLVAKLQEELTSITIAPPDWLTLSRLAKNIKRSLPKVREIAEELRNEYPEWFQLFRDQSSKNIEHIHPELILEIKKRMNNIEFAPDGWETAGGLGKKLGKNNADPIRRRAEKHREEHPEWFKQYTIRKQGNVPGENREHLSPKLVEQIKKELGYT